MALVYDFDGGRLDALSRKSYNGTEAIWQRYDLAHDAFGNNASISVSRSDEYGSWSDGRTLASYAYSGNNGLLARMSYGNGAYIDYTYDLFL